MIQFSKCLMPLVFLVTSMSLVSAQDDLKGDWTVTAETPEGDKTSVWTIAGTGDELSVTSVSDETGEKTEFMDVELSDEELTCAFEVEVQGMQLRVNMEVKLSDGKLEGDWVAVDPQGNEMAGGAIEGVKAAAEKSEMEVLFDGKSMDNFRGYKQEEIGKSWTIVDDTLHYDGNGGGDIMTKKEYGSFELTFDWKISEGGNSGVMYRVKPGDNAPYFTGVEYQILDNEKHKDGKKPVTSAGSLYALYAPGDKQPKAVGEWNTSKIVLDGNKVQHWLNGEKVVDVEIGSDDWNKKIAGSKFAKWKKFAKSDRGHIAFQDHGNPVWYRNIKIKAMD